MSNLLKDVPANAERIIEALPERIVDALPDRLVDVLPDRITDVLPGRSRRSSLRSSLVVLAVLGVVAAVTMWLKPWQRATSHNHSATGDTADSRPVDDVVEV